MKSLPSRLVPVVALGLVLSAAPVRADVVDRALVENAPAIAAAVRTLDADYVAVLKFAVRVGKQPPTFDAGLANTQLVQKLENLLVLTYDKNQPGSPVPLTGAAAKAGTLPKDVLPPDTTWRDEAGRGKLAKVGGLPTAWNADQAIDPDAFITGELQLSEDLSAAKVVLYAFTRDNPSCLKPLYTTPDGTPEKPAVPTDRSLLTLVGASFAVTDRALDSHAAGDREAVRKALANMTQPAAFAQKMALSPVKLEVQVNGHPVAPDADPFNPATGRIGSAATAPRHGDEVWLKLTNTDKARKYGVLLAVNGKNTNGLDDDHLNARPPQEHRLWVLEPGQEVMVTGFYTKKAGQNFLPFKVLGETESEAAYPLMGEQYRGLITMHVFGEQVQQAAAPQAKPPVKPLPMPMPTPPVPAVEAEAEQAAKVSFRLSLGVGGAALKGVRSAATAEKAQTALQELTRVRSETGGRLGVSPDTLTSDRGLIVPSDSPKAGGTIETAKGFRLDPSFLAFVQLRYYGR